MRTNPYTALLNDIRAFCLKLKYRKRVAMWHYPKGKLTDGWRLDDLAERVQAANQLGYDVVLSVDNGDLRVYYVERVQVPYRWE